MGTRIRRWLAWGGALAVSGLLALPARADPTSGGYVATVTDNTVKVCLSFSSCGSAMLRQAADGTVVALAGSLNGNTSNCYIDECVQPGTYRYGCETPLACACDSPPYWASATVTEALDAGCTRRAGDSPPVPASGVPWTGDAGYVACPRVCNGFGPPCDAGSGSDASSGTDAGSSRDAGSGKDAGSGSGEVIVGGCGCSSVRSVFVFDGSVLLFSLALLGRRRRRARTHR
jgi:hypothetical protein